MDVLVHKPYPKVRVLRKNISIAEILLEDYSGINGELTAICQYVYQRFDKSFESALFCDVLEKIAAVEMLHLKLLGQTIKLLGLSPKFITCRDDLYWNSSFVDYNTNIKMMLLSDIFKEKEAIKNYKYHISIIDDIYVVELLNRIIEDEEKHLECFSTFLKMINEKDKV